MMWTLCCICFHPRAFSFVWVFFISSTESWSNEERNQCPQLPGRENLAPVTSKTGNRVSLRRTVEVQRWETPRHARAGPQDPLGAPQEEPAHSAGKLATLPRKEVSARLPPGRGSATPQRGHHHTDRSKTPRCRPHLYNDTVIQTETDTPHKHTHTHTHTETHTWTHNHRHKSSHQC